MISDDPDEDADCLDDESLLREYLGIQPGPDTEGAKRHAMRDWPAAPSDAVRLSIDSATTEWFRANHADWRKQMASVLRAWVAAQAATKTGSTTA